MIKTTVDAKPTFHKIIFDTFIFFRSYTNKAMILLKKEKISVQNFSEHCKQKY